MEHGVSWLSFLPGVRQFEAYLQHTSEAVAGRQGFLFNRPLVIQHVLAAVLVALIVLAVAFKARADLKRAGDNAVIPDPKPSVRNFLEATFEWLYGQARAIIGDEAPRYFPVIATLALFIFFSNVLGLVPGFLPPTDNWNTTGACAVFVFLYYNYQGLRVHGLKHIGHMANPSGEWWGWFLAPLMLPIELVSHVARP
ncbi:MAG: F0F1 ATP synthase subunit A, partial [Deltaproteobacteria bacterium]|nr:F0F1 ATP synthase subunit A [Deltaproteobacteria bacterium]